MESQQVFRSVLTWLAHDIYSPPENTVQELIDWFTSENLDHGTLDQCLIKRQLQPFLPALLSDTYDVNFTDTKNRTLLNFCVSKMNNDDHNRYQDVRLISTLCKLGASIIADDRNGCSPLSIALTKDRAIWLVKALLLFSQTSPTESNSSGQTLLHIFLDNHKQNQNFHVKYPDIIDDLILKGADLDKPDNNGVTAVHLLAKSLDTDLLNIFRDHRARLDRRTNCGDNLIILACKNIFDRTVKSRTANHLITESNTLKTAEFIKNLPLYHVDLNVNRQNNHGFTPLHYAFKGDNLSVATFLVIAGADVHAVANDNTNPLHAVAMLSSFEMMMDMIYSRCADLGLRDNVYGFTLIHAAAMSYDQRKLDWLLSLGFDPNDLGECGLTPLLLAAIVGNAKVVEMLIAHGVNLHCRADKFKYTALHLATMRGRFASIQKICGTNSNDDASSLYTHCFESLQFEADPRADYTSTVCKLLEAGAYVNSRDVHGCTPLHYAAKQSSNNLVEFLLKAGAHVDVQDEECFTPLHNCLLENNTRGLIYLWRFGANINDIGHPKQDILKALNNLENPTVKVVLRQLMRMKAAGLPINDLYKSYSIYSNLEQYSYLAECVDEVKKLKMWMLSPEVSFYDLLKMNFRRRLYFMKNLPVQLEIEFPVYQNVLMGRCNEAVSRNRLMEPAKVAVVKLTGWQLPDLCVEHVLSFLNNNALGNLVLSVTGSEGFDRTIDFEHYGNQVQ